MVFLVGSLNRTRSKEGVAKSLPFCNLQLIRVENCLQLFDWIRLTVDGNRRKWEYRVSSSMLVSFCPWQIQQRRITEETSLRFSRNINICGEAVKVTWNFYRLRSMMLLFLSELWVFYSIDSTRRRSIVWIRRLNVRSYLVVFLYLRIREKLRNICILLLFN